jgi:hypothetical protein
VLINHLRLLPTAAQLLFESSDIASTDRVLRRPTAKMTANNATTHEDATDSPQSTSTPVMAEKDAVGSNVEIIHTNERVPGHPGYYEKDGLRTYGDDFDHDHEPPVRLRSFSGTPHIIADASSTSS